MHCHAPTSFYGDDEADILTTTSQVSEGVTCSFCHTLRDVRTPESLGPFVEAMAERLGRGETGPEAMAEAVAAAGFPPDAGLAPGFGVYTSSPQTVRRYFGQASSDPVARWLGNLLIRWRPDMHRIDYRPEILSTSEACRGCHGFITGHPLLPHRTYDTWASSDFNSGEPDEIVHCQDCHMVLDPAHPADWEDGRLVDWGPRQSRRNHLFLGGNTHFAEAVRDEGLLELEIAYARQGTGLHIRSVEATDEGLRVHMTVRPEHVGHLYPAMESLVKVPCVWLEAVDSAGEVVAEEPCTSDNGGTFIRQVDMHTFSIAGDTTIPAGEQRDFSMDLTLPEGPEPVRVRAYLGLTMGQPTQSTELALD